jgi:hydrogenase/urease accessory protein HupE
MRKLFVSSAILFIATFTTLSNQAQAHPFNYGAIKTRLTAQGSQVVLHTEAPQNIKFVNEDEDAYQQRAQDYFSDNLRITYNKTPCKFTLNSFGNPSNQTIFDGTYTCSSSINSFKNLKIHGELFNDYFGSAEHFVTLTIGEQQQHLIFNQSHTDYPKNVKPIPQTAFGRFLAAAKQFVWMGMLHIWTGYDHILFLISVILLLRSVKKILIIVTTFTIAHTITLILAGLGIITISPRIVEPLIALTIIYMALRNIQLLYKKEKIKNITERQATTGSFGLIHGLGFAGALLATQIPKEFFVPSLLFFNIGVELGQLCLLLLIVPLLFWSDKLPRHRLILMLVSFAIVLLSTFWFIERVFLY